MSSRVPPTCRRLRRIAWALLGLVAPFASTPGHALRPGRALSQYLRAPLEGARRLAGRTVGSIAGSADGYRWIGTTGGLAKFDGVASDGKRVHWGLPGMRERVARLRGHCEIASVPGEGTTINLRLPAAIAYERRPG